MIPTSKIALLHTADTIDAQLLACHTNAAKVLSKRHTDNGWLHLIECQEPKTYDELNAALNSIEAQNKKTLFLPILDDGGSTDGRIVLSPSFIDGFQADETWQQPSSSAAISDLLIPGFKRLSKQLKVDFAINVHGSEGKRKREPTRSIYEEATAADATLLLDIADKKRRKTPAKKACPKTSNTKRAIKRKARSPVASPDISEIDEDEFGLAPLPTDPQFTAASFSLKALDAITKAHAEAMASKDDTVKALTNALMAKDELIRTQAALIAMLQK